MRARARSLSAWVGAALLLLLGGWWLASNEPDPASPQAMTAKALPPRSPASNPLDALNEAAPPTSTLRTPEAFEQWLTQHSSLRGVSLDGAWDVAGDGRLRPTLALRRRFDQLLSLVGETRLDEITAFIAHDVRETFGAAAATQVIELWQRYLALQRHAFLTRADMHERNTWAPAQAERQQVRQHLLGDEVAKAFFADDDAQFQALLNAPAVTTTGTPYSGIDRGSLEPAAAERLKNEELAWADWERRLADARREHAALQARAELSSLQREQAIERYVAQRFDAAELRRIRALLQLAQRG